MLEHTKKKLKKLSLEIYSLERVYYNYNIQ